jgi:hypothetical protein
MERWRTPEGRRSFLQILFGPEELFEWNDPEYERLCLLQATRCQASAALMFLLHLGGEADWGEKIYDGALELAGDLDKLEPVFEARIKVITDRLREERARRREEESP